jgi:dihydropyrimidinase
MQILIKNGIIVNSDQNIAADLVIKDGRIALIGKGIEKEVKVKKIIDASGCYIFPGGVDPHVHLNLPTPAGYSSDDFVSGSKAALFGGTTCLIDFVTPQRGQSMVEAFESRKEEATKCLVDFKLHLSPVEWDINTEKEMQNCFEREGVRSFKVYMAYRDTIGLSDSAIFRTMKTVADLGGVLCVHCEMGNEIELIQNDFVKQGNTSVEYHAQSRPREMELKAVNRVIDYASKTGCQVYIVHVSTKESIESIRQAQGKLIPVYAETCPQYLLFDEEKYNQNFENASAYIISPPLRQKADIDALWQALADGTIQSIGTDHCPFNLSQKKFGITDFRKIPNGTGGIEHRLELLYTYGVLENKISINRFVDLVSTMPAKIFGLAPKKGTISRGADADIVIWDPDCEREISAKSHHQNCDLNIYEGLKIKGQVKHLIVKGKNIIENYLMVNQPKGLYVLK